MACLAQHDITPLCVGVYAPCPHTHIRVCYHRTVCQQHASVVSMHSEFNGVCVVPQQEREREREQDYTVYVSVRCRLCVCGGGGRE